MASIPKGRWSINRFLKTLASAQPVPGGGSAAALAGALGSDLGSMVCRILLGRPKTSSSKRVKIKKSLAELERLSSKLKNLIQEDAKAYQRLLRAFRTGRGITAARQQAVRCPLEICEASVQAAHILKSLSGLAGPSLGADLKAGRALLQGAFSAASEMVEVNLKG